MSSTRRARPGTPLRQERFSSSPVFRTEGLKPALVAARCAVLVDADEKEIIWHLQFRSHQPEGLGGVVEELLRHFPERTRPTWLDDFKGDLRAPLSVELTQRLRSECEAVERFLLCGEFSEREQEFLDYADRWDAVQDYLHAPEERKETVRRSQQRPKHFTAEDFIQHTQEQARNQLERHLVALCLNPEQGFEDPWYFQDLKGALVAILDAYAAQQSTAADTNIGRALAEAMDYARDTGSVVLFSGPNGTGKSYQAKALCNQWPGRCRYVELPPGNDRRTFFKSFADSFGGPAGNAWKAQELQARIEEISAQAGVVLVLDDARQLLPDREREATPDRVDWVVAALAERGVPAVLITKPEFDARLLAIQERSRWSANDFYQRVFRWNVPALDQADIRATAESMFPSAGPRDWTALSQFASVTYAGSLHGLEKARRLAEFSAAGQPVTSEHIRQALVGPAGAEANQTKIELAKAQKKAGRKFTRAPFAQAAATGAQPLREAAAEIPRPAREGLAADAGTRREIRPTSRALALTPGEILTAPAK